MSTLAASGNNSSIGTAAITINGGGTFSYTGATVSGIDRLITIGAGGGTLQASSGSAATLTLTGGIAMAGNALTINTTGAGPANIVLSTTGISGTAGSNLTKAGTGLLTLNVASSNIGSTTITGGKIVNGVANALLSTNALILNASGTFDMASFAQTVASLTGSGTLTNSSTAATFTNNESSTNSFTRSCLGSHCHGDGRNRYLYAEQRCK